ncbi:MAG: 3-phosphoshikimate 1-carboxyvinyltransferase [Coprococcus sp.]
MIFKRTNSLKGELNIPGDKSVSHRSIMMGSLAEGTTEVHGFLNGADCISSMNCFRQMGVNIDYDGNIVTIHGNGLHGLKCPAGTLDVGNSGTTTRLMSGILAAQPFTSRIIGDASICKRPMKRIMTPLRMMGADITSELGNNCAPLIIKGQPLKGIHYDSAVASAQVKSCILLAGLYADGETSVTEPYVSRNHTELMFKSFGVPISVDGTTVTIKPTDKLTGQKIMVPGDISSAAYFIVAGLITPNSCITIHNVGINPTRDGIIEVVRQMGGDITFSNISDNVGEPTCDITVRTSNLKGCTIEGELIPKLIDEIPVIAILACFAKGTTIIKDAAELKVKESDRITEMVTNLSAMGADITATDDGMIINGGNTLHGAVINSKLDHRIAMSFAIAGLNADGETEIIGAENADTSYPGFYSDLNKLM